MNSLRARLLLSAGCVLLVFVLLTAFALDAADQQRAEAAVNDRLQGLVYTLLGALDINDTGQVSIEDADLPDPRLKRPDSGLAAVVTGGDGTILWHSFSTLDLSVDVPAADVGQWRFSSPQYSEEPFSLVFGFSWMVGNKEQLFRLAVIESPATFLKQRRAFRQSLWLSLSLAALLLLALLLAILHWGLLPLGRLASEVSAVEAGKLESVSEHYPSEIQPLAGGLNALLRNERVRQQRYRNALADLAHSLKTPLAAIRGQLGKPLLDTEPLERMQQLIDYQLRKAVAGSGRSFAAPVAVAPLIDRLLSALSKVHAERGLLFDNQVDPTTQVRLEQGDLLEVFGNLLDNAARFASTRIQITASQQAASISLQVHDDGPGFPDSDRETLLQRGIRADSRSPGQGIGLAVVTEIVQAHDGRIRLGKSPLGGALIEIELPAN